MVSGQHLTSGTFPDDLTRLSSCSGLTLCASSSDASLVAKHLHTPSSPRYPSLNDPSSLASLTSLDDCAYVTAFSSLCDVYDAALDVPSIVVEDLSHDAGSCPPRNSLGLWQTSSSAPDLGHLEKLPCHAPGDLHDCSLRVPPGSWSDDNTLAADSQPCTKSIACSWQNVAKEDSIERPWLDLGDDDPDDSLVNTSGLADLAFSPGFCLSSLSFSGTIGRGGYGKVLLAEHAPDAGVTSGHGSQVAVKVLAKKHMNNDDIQELKIEVRVLREVAWGPDIGVHGRGSEFQQKLQGVFQTREHVFIIMDRHCAPLSHPHFRRCLRLRSSSIAALASPPCLSPLPASFSLPMAFPSFSSISTPYEEALHSLRLLSAELVLGLLFLHERGIVHQDLKPANILVSPGGHAVITDFGSSRFMPEIAEMSSPRGHHTLHMNDPDFAWPPQQEHAPHAGVAVARYGPIVLGPDDQVSFTRRYAAPELLGVHAQASGGLDAHDHDADHDHGFGSSIIVYDERVDFYSLGVMLRELALGEAADSSDAKRQDAWERASDGQRARDVVAVPLDPDFEDFTGQLSAYHPHHRLHGPAAKDHAFFEPLQGSWDGVAALQFPPLPDVVWQEPDEDTRLDLRTYSGPADSQDSLASAAELRLWRDEQLADIPFDPSARAPAGTLSLAADNSPELGGLRPPMLLPAAVSLSVASSMASTLRSESRPDAPQLQATRSWIDSSDASYTSSPDAGRHPHTLRRRPALYDLRQAYNSASVLAPHAVYPLRHPYVYQAKPKRQTRSVAAAKAAPRGGADVVPGAGAWSFEHQITIAMLATMSPPSSQATGGESDARVVTPLTRERSGTRVKAFFRRLKVKRLA